MALGSGHDHEGHSRRGDGIIAFFLTLKTQKLKTSEKGKVLLGPHPQFNTAVGCRYTVKNIAKN